MSDAAIQSCLNPQKIYLLTHILWKYYPPKKFNIQNLEVET